MLKNSWKSGDQKIFDTYQDLFTDPKKSALLQARFDRVDAEYRKIMYGIAGDQRLVSLCNQTALSDKLANILDQLQRSVHYLCSAYLPLLLLNI